MYTCNAMHMYMLCSLYDTHCMLHYLIQEGDYPAATQLCLECQNAIQTYKQYTCVRYDSFHLTLRVFYNG